MVALHRWQLRHPQREKLKIERNFEDASVEVDAKLERALGLHDTILDRLVAGLPRRVHLIGGNGAVLPPFTS